MRTRLGAASACIVSATTPANAGVEVGRVVVDAAVGHVASIAEEPFRYSAERRR